MTVAKNWSKMQSNERQPLVEPERPVRFTTPPTWTRPDCGDVADLSAHNPLLPCKKTTGDEASYRPQAHRPQVQRGYGVPLVFVPSGQRRRSYQTRTGDDEEAATQEELLDREANLLFELQQIRRELNATSGDRHLT